MDDIEEVTHFPRFASGCYYQRLNDCCWLCMLRIFRANIHAARRSASMDIPASVEAEIESIDVPASTASVEERQRTALAAAYLYLRDHGTATKTALVEAVYTNHSAGYSDAQRWWQELLNPGLQQLSRTTRRENGTWQHTT